jgi:hypothetical protein
VAAKKLSRHEKVEIEQKMHKSSHCSGRDRIFSYCSKCIKTHIFPPSNTLLNRENVNTFDEACWNIAPLLLRNSTKIAPPSSENRRGAVCKATSHSNAITCSLNTSATGLLPAASPDFCPRDHGRSSKTRICALGVMCVDVLSPLHSRPLHFPY